MPAWPAGLKTYFEKVSSGEGESKTNYSLRYIGAPRLVVAVVRTQRFVGAIGLALEPLAW